jgi:hypothetical protein
MDKFTDIAIIHLLKFKATGNLNHLNEANRIIGMIKTELEAPDNSWRKEEAV